MFDLLDPNKNGFRHSSLSTKFTLSCVLASLWSIVFGIITAEAIYFGYSLVGHLLAVTMAFATYVVFTQERKHSHPSPPNKCVWDLEKEG